VSPATKYEWFGPDKEHWLASSRAPGTTATGDEVSAGVARCRPVDRVPRLLGREPAMPCSVATHT
jgi:hypothetical protein